MGTYVGDAGGIKVGKEAVTYGTLAATLIAQTPISATLGPRMRRIAPSHLGVAASTFSKFGVGYSDGDVVVGYHRKRSVIGPWLESLGKLTTNTFAFGTGVVPDAASLSVQIDHGGYLMQYLGLVVSKLRWDFTPNEAIRLTVELLGRKGTKESWSAAFTQPTEADIQMASDISTVTIGGTAVCFLSGSIEVSRAVTGADRICLGSSTIKQPQHSGRWMVSANFQCELSADTGNNTVAELDDYLSGTSIGDVVVDDWTLAGCYIIGDPPSLAAGLATFPLNLEAASLALVTEA